MKAVTKRMHLIGFLLKSLPGIVRDSGGWVKFAKWFAQALRFQGIGYCAGELTTKAARSRRNDEELYRIWIRNHCLSREEKTIDRVFLSKNNTPNEVQGHTGLIINDSWLAALENESVELYSFLNAEDQHFITIARDSCQFDSQWFAKAGLAIANGARLVYCDHDRVDKHGRRSPFFKPDLSVELLGHQSYLPAIAVDRKWVLSIIPGNMTISPPIDNIINSLSRATSRVSHIPEVLVHLQGDDQPSTQTTEPDETKNVRSLTSIIIPTFNRFELLHACVTSIRKYTQRSLYEIVIVDNGSNDPEILAWFETQRSRSDIRIISAPIKFSWSRLSNIGRQVATGEFLIFMNNDVEISAEGWLERLTALAARSGVGAVGPLLLYADDTVQHAGIVIGFGGFADHVYSGSTLQAASESYFVSPLVTRNVSAVTGACLVISSTCFDAIGQFDERFEVAGDVELCLRLIQMGYRNIYDGRTRMYHHESRTRLRGLPTKDMIYLRKKIDEVMPQGDPFYNPNLSLKSKFPLVDILN